MNLMDVVCASMLSLVLIAGCGAEPECLRETTRLQPDEVSALGLSPLELAAAVAGDEELPLLWYGRAGGAVTLGGAGEQTRVRWAVTADPDAAVYIDQRVNPRNTDESGKDCPDMLELQGTLALATDDGRFAEAAIPVTTRVESRDGGSLAGIITEVEPLAVPFATLAGTAATQAQPDDAALLLRIDQSRETGAVAGFRIGGMIDRSSGETSIVGVADLACAAVELVPACDEGE
jgi:hypothetical protein